MLLLPDMRKRMLPIFVLLILPAAVLGPILWFTPAKLAATDARLLLHESISSGGLSTLDARANYERPLAADPRAALFYPPTWLFAFLAPDRAALVFILGHSALALWGMYHLLRSQRRARSAALFGAVVFAYCGFMSAHLNDLPSISAAAWIPIAFWRIGRYTQLGGIRYLAFASFGAALVGLTGQMQVFTLTAVGSLLFLLPQSENTARSIARWGLTWFCALGLFAVQVLPILAWITSGYARWPSYSEFLSTSWNPLLLVSWFLPNFAGSTWMLSSAPASYIGILPLVLAALAVYSRRRLSRAARGWVILLIPGLLLALGRYGPIHPLLYWIPGAALFRNPANALLLFELAVAALAAGTVHDLQAKISPARARFRAVVIDWTQQPILLTIYLYGVPLLAVLVLAYLNSASEIHFKLTVAQLCVPFVTIGISVVTLWLVIRRWRRPTLIWLLVLVAFLDLTAAAWTAKIPAGPEFKNRPVTPPAKAARQTRARTSIYRRPHNPRSDAHRRTRSARSDDVRGYMAEIS